MCSKDLKYSCTFCGKHHSEVENIYCATEHKCICDECLELCNEIAKNREITIKVDLGEDGSIKSVEKSYNAG